MRTVSIVFAFVLLIVIGLFAGSLFYGGLTLHQLLTENRRLKEAISHLTQEDQIGYAKVLSQETRDGTVYTTLRFVQTARDDKRRTILEKEYTIQGDVVHFDALIVKFDNRLVLDGKERALYLWRRVYGEHTPPNEGYPIEEPGISPKRYEDLLNRLSLRERELFWSQIWELANDPSRLEQYGIVGLYGNAVYAKLSPDLIYVFKISATGQVYPEVVPDL